MEKKSELFTIKPSLRQYYGRTIRKDTAFDEYTDNKEVHQTLKDLVLITEIIRKKCNNLAIGFSAYSY